MPHCTEFPAKTTPLKRRKTSRHTPTGLCQCDLFSLPPFPMLASGGMGPRSRRLHTNERRTPTCQPEAVGLTRHRVVSRTFQQSSCLLAVRSPGCTMQMRGERHGTLETARISTTTQQGCPGGQTHPGRRCRRSGTTVRWVHCPQDYHPRLSRWFCIEHAAACDLFDDPLGRKTINRRLPAGWKRDLSPAKLSFILIHGAFVSYNLSLLA